MCGRYTFREDAPEYYERALNTEFPGVQPRSNIKPMNLAPVIRLTQDEPVIEAIQWSLVPFWPETPTLKLSPCSEGQYLT